MITWLPKTFSEKGRGLRPCPDAEETQPFPLPADGPKLRSLHPYESERDADKSEGLGFRRDGSKTRSHVRKILSLLCFSGELLTLLCFLGFNLVF